MQRVPWDFWLLYHKESVEIINQDSLKKTLIPGPYHPDLMKYTAWFNMRLAHFERQQDL